MSEEEGFSQLDKHRQETRIATIDKRTRTADSFIEERTWDR